MLPPNRSLMHLEPECVETFSYPAALKEFNAAMSEPVGDESASETHL